MSLEPPRSSARRELLRSLFRRSHRRTKDTDESQISLRTPVPENNTASALLGTFVELWTVASSQDSEVFVQCELECALPHPNISLKELDSIVKRGAVIEQHIRLKSLSSVTTLAKGLISAEASAAPSDASRDVIRSKIEEEAERWRDRRDLFASLLGDVAFVMADKPVVHWKCELADTDGRRATNTAGELISRAERG